MIWCYVWEWMKEQTFIYILMSTKMGKYKQEYNINLVVEGRKKRSIICIIISNMVEELYPTINFHSYKKYIT